MHSFSKEEMMVLIAAKAKALMESGCPEQALPMLQEWERLAKQLDDRRALAGCLCSQGEAQAALGEAVKSPRFVAAREMFQRAQSLYSELGNFELEAIAVSLEANLTRHGFRDFRAAVRLYERAMGLAQSAGRADLVANIQRDLSESRSRIIRRAVCLVIGLLLALAALVALAFWGLNRYQE